MISPDEYLERVVAGIQAVTTQGAEVTWNERINERQFDVVVRFTLGTLTYLVVFEVKNKTRKASVSEVEAFVTKARDQRADKAVFVTVAGYQNGAINVARRHGVDLFTVAFDETKPYLPKNGTYVTLTKQGHPDAKPELRFGEPVLMDRIVDIVVAYTDGSEHRLPDEQSAATYYIRRSTLADGRTLHKVLQEAQFPTGKEGVTFPFEIKIDPPQALVPPDDIVFPGGSLVVIKASVVGVMTRPIEGNILLEPNSLVLPVIYENVLTGQSIEFDVSTLPIGEKRMAAGNFYFQLHPLNYVYCSAIEGRTVHVKLIESFQNGQLIRATMSTDTSNSVRYIRVTDRKKIAELERRLEAYDALSRPKPSPPTIMLPR